MPRSRQRTAASAVSIHREVARRQAGYALLEAITPLLACGFLATVIAAGLIVQRPAVGSPVSSSEPAAKQQSPTDSPSADPSDPTMVGGPRPTPQGAESRLAYRTRAYDERLAARGARGATPFHGTPGGDFTGDGFSDIMVVQPRATNILDGTDPTGGFGTVSIWEWWGVTPALTLTGPFQNDLFGISAKSAGDLDGDGADDIIVGGMLDHGDSGLEGAVHVYSGIDGELLMHLIGEEWEYLGRTVAGASDVDGDGQWDIAASSWVYEDHQPKGMVSLHSGSDGALIRTYTARGFNDGFGYEIISMGDLDGDTFSEIAISSSLAPGDPRAIAPSTGQVHIFPGAARGTAPEHLTTAAASVTIYNPDPSIDHFGVVLELTTDQDGDGLPDLLVGSISNPYDPALKTTTIQVFSSANGNLLWPTLISNQRDGDDPYPSVDEDGNLIHYAHHISGLGITGDPNRDLKSEQADLDHVITRFGQEAEVGNPVSGDVSQTGSVDLDDMNQVVGAFGDESIIRTYVEDTQRLLTRWNALDPYQYGDYILDTPTRQQGQPRGGMPQPGDPNYPAPDPYFPGVYVSGLDDLPGCKGYINHPSCGALYNMCVMMCCALADCGPTDIVDPTSPKGSGGNQDSNGNGIPDNVDCEQGGRPVAPPGCDDPCADDDGDGIPNQYDCDSPCFDDRYAPIGSDGLPCLPCEDDDGDGIRNQDDCDSACFFIPSTSPGEWGPVDTECKCRDTDEDGIKDRDEDDDCDGIPNHLDCDSDCYEGDPDCCVPDAVTGIRPQDNPESDCYASSRVKITVHRPKALNPGETSISDEDKLTVGVQLFENIDNDDRDGKFDTGTDDLGVAGENDMCKVVVKIPAGFREGSLLVEIAQGGGSVLLWKDAIKSDLFNPAIPLQIPGDVPPGGSYTLWLEGLEAATAQRTVQVKATLSTDCGSTEDAFNATLLGVQSVAWEGIGNSVNHNNALDSDPNWPTAQMSAGGIPQGLRVFPGGRFSGGAVTAAKDKVRVHVTLTTKPVEPVTVYLKSFDVDDPTADSDVVDNESVAEDNRGTSPGKAGAFVTTGTPKGSVEINSTDDTASIDFRVTMQPGDNFRVVAGPDKAYLDFLENDDVQINALGGSNAEKQMLIDPQVAVPAGSAVAGQVRHADRYVSPTLTVWRFLHVEVDSMGPVTDNHIEGYITALNTGDSLTATRATVSTPPSIPAVLNDGSPMPPAGNGRFENGTLTLAGGTHAISPLNRNGSDYVERDAVNGGLNICAQPLPFAAVHARPLVVHFVTGTVTRIQSGLLSVNVNSGNLANLDTTQGSNTIRIFGAGPDGSMTISAVSVANSTIIVNSLKVPFMVEDDDSPDGTIIPRPDTSRMALAFRPAYVLPKESIFVGDETLPFKANIQDVGNMTDGWSFTNNGLRDSHFWVIYIRGAFQSETSLYDNDPDGEGITWGISSPGFGMGTGGVNIYWESHNESVGMPTPNLPGRGFQEEDTVVHEVGHLFGCGHGDAGVMGDDFIGLFDSIDFSATSLNTIRNRSYP